MKVLVISGAFPPTQAGEADHALHLCERLAERGLDVSVLTSRGPVRRNHLPATVYAVMKNWSWSELPRLAMVLRRSAPDAVLLLYTWWIYKYHPMVTFAPSVAKAVLPGVRFVTQFEATLGARPDESAAFTRVVRKAVALWAGGRTVNYTFGTLLRDSDRVIIMSEVHRPLFAAQQPSVADKIVLIPPPPILRVAPRTSSTDRRVRREHLGVAHDEFLLAFFGYVYPNKGVETLFRALNLLCARGRNVKLVMIGGGVLKGYAAYGEEVHSLLKALNIGDRVIWTPEYPSESDEASRLLGAADACVLPFDEGILLHRSSVAAATAHGLPIVSTRATTLESQFVDRRNVLLCAPQNPASLAEAIEELLDSSDLRQQLSGGSEELAREWFSWDAAVDKTLHTFEANEGLRDSRRLREA